VTVVADRTIGGEYQNMLAEAGPREYKEAFTLYVKVLNQDGYLAGTYPLRGDEKVMAAYTQAQQLQAVALVRPLTTREQKALIDALDVLEKANA